MLVDSGKHGVKACSDRDQPAGVALHLIAIPSEAWGREGDRPVSPLSSPLNRHSSWAKAWGTEINLRVAFESFYLERKSVPMVLLVVQEETAVREGEAVARAAAHLPVGEDGGVEALQRLAQDRRTHLGVHGLLRRILAEDEIETVRGLGLARRERQRR